MFVTHNVYEAVFLSQRVVVISERPGHVTAEVVVGAPYPRTNAFRASAEYLEACRAVTAALEAA